MMPRHRERGSAIVETSTVLVVALMLVFGIIDMSRAMYTYHTVANLASQGARWAMVRGATCGINSSDVGASSTYCSPSGNTCTVNSTSSKCANNSDIQTFVQSQVIGIMTPSSVQVTPQWNTTNSCSSSVYPNSNGPGCTVEVTVTYPFSFFLPYMPSLGSTINMSYAATTTISQ
jgi:Flp pilus assembly protein TadG